jgi:hypothetical protein
VREAAKIAVDKLKGGCGGGTGSGVSKGAQWALGWALPVCRRSRAGVLDQALYPIWCLCKPQLVRV